MKVVRCATFLVNCNLKSETCRMCMHIISVIIRTFLRTFCVSSVYNVLR